MTPEHMRDRRHTGIAADRADAGYAEPCLHLEPIMGSLTRAPTLASMGAVGRGAAFLIARAPVTQFFAMADATP